VNPLNVAYLFLWKLLFHAAKDAVAGGAWLWMRVSFSATFAGRQERRMASSQAHPSTDLEEPHHGPSQVRAHSADSWEESPDGVSELRNGQRVKLFFILLRDAGFSIRAINPEIRDPISQMCVEAVLARGPMSVSGVARYVKQASGRASRTTIRKRLKALEAKGILCFKEPESYWVLGADFVRRIWQFSYRWLGEAP
jgi:hypothetical protein